jgi:colanic acid biosynthesis glycosyl transferase WcaI
MKIILWGINYAPEPTGIAPFNQGLCRHLAAAGHEVTAVTAFPYYPFWRKSPADAGRWRRVETMEGVTVDRGWCYVPKTAGTARRIAHELSFGLVSLWRVLRLPRADVYVVVSPPLALGFFAWIATRIKQSRFVFHVQDMQPDAAVGLGMLKRGWLVRALYGLERLAYAKSARLSGISAGAVAAFIEKKVPAEKCVLFPNWLHAEKIVAVNSKSAARRQFGVPSDALLAVYAGNLGKKQGLEILVMAAERMAFRADAVAAGVQIIIAGDGAARADLALRLAAAPNPAVTLLPLLSEIDYQALLAAADVALITQTAGSGRFFFPSKLLSVLAAGLPVIAVADEGSELDRAVQEGGFGRVVAPGDTWGLAATLCELAADRQALHGWREHTVWVQKFASERVLPEFERVLGAVVAAGANSAKINPSAKPAPAQP